MSDKSLGSAVSPLFEWSFTRKNFESTRAIENERFFDGTCGEKEKETRASERERERGLLVPWNKIDERHVINAGVFHISFHPLCKFVAITLSSLPLFLSVHTTLRAIEEKYSSSIARRSIFA